MTPVFSTEALERLSRAVLEDAAFLLVEAATELPLPDRVVQARLAFTGPGRGSMTLTTTPALAREVAANMLGIDEADEDAVGHADNALGELLNIVCGMVTAEMYGARNTCSLQPPKVTHLAPVDSAPVAAWTVRFNAGEDKPVQVDVYLDEASNMDHNPGAKSRDPRPGGG